MALGMEVGLVLRTKLALETVDLGEFLGVLVT